MAAAPRFKLYDRHGNYLGALKACEDCAAVIANYPGGTVRDGHRKKDAFFTQGETGDAGESYDNVHAALIATD